MTGSTLYPAAIDGFPNLPDDKTDDTVTAGDHANHHNNLADAVVAVETELGVNPKGTYADVAAAIANKVDKTPTADQVIQALGDVVGLMVKASATQSTKNVFEMRLANNAIAAFINKDGILSAQGFKVAGVDLNSSHLFDGAQLAHLASPTFTGTPTAPTPTVGDNSTKIATTEFTTTAIAASTPPAAISGVLSARPAANTRTGGFYYATDQDTLWFSTGAAWIRIGVPAGTTVLWFQPFSTVPTGWVAYDGTSLPASTGIYADLTAHLTTTTKPDTRGRVAVGKGSHSDVNAIGLTEGLSVNSRRVRHKHTVVNPTIVITDPGHSHTVPLGSPINSGGSATNGVGTFNPGPIPTTSINTTGITATATGMSVGPQTGFEPTDGPAYIVALYIAKL